MPRDPPATTFVMTGVLVAFTQLVPWWTFLAELQANCTLVNEIVISARFVDRVNKIMHIALNICWNWLQHIAGGLQHTNDSSSSSHGRLD
jgi:hypothetical protein